jgi:hypothetical protein
MNANGLSASFKKLLKVDIFQLKLIARVSELFEDDSQEQ